MYDILVILVDFLWKISIILADVLLSDPFLETDPDPNPAAEMKRIRTDPDPKHWIPQVYPRSAHPSLVDEPGIRLNIYTTSQNRSAINIIHGSISYH